MAAYAPTNTVILTESASNIRRLIAILESIDVETYKEDLAVINVEYADAATLADQVSEIYGAEVAEGGGAFDVARARRAAASPTRQRPERAAERASSRRCASSPTSARTRCSCSRRARSSRRCAGWSRSSTCPVPGGGRIHVYYLNNANAEELAETLAGLVGGGGGGGERPQPQHGARRRTGGAHVPRGGHRRRRRRRPRSAPRWPGSRAASA